MSVKLWAPDHPDGCHISLTNGRTFMVPNHEAGIEVPKEFRRVAIARGCVSVGTESEETESDCSDRPTMVRTAAKRATLNTKVPDYPIYQVVHPHGGAVDPEALPRPETAVKEIVADQTVASLGDRTAGEIMRRLRAAGDRGLTRTDISDVFTRHRASEQIGTALDLLLRKGWATCESVRTGGRPTELWRPAK